MNSIPKSNSEIDNSRELDFIDYWGDQTVESEVLRGQKLRVEKLSLLPHKEPNIPKLDVIKLRYGSKRKACKRKKYGNKSHSASKSKSCLTRTPLRIIELSVPTKRHCIDTWRYKSDVLPAVMVDRLKRQVMDQKPIVHVSDAVCCFKKQKKCLKKRTDKVTSNSKIMQNVKQNDKHMVDIGTLCAIFSHRLAKKLIKPTNITLNSELDDISKIVATDISNLVKKRQKAFSNTNNIVIDDRKYKEIWNEVSNKITIWISGILEDASYKLLLEDLRELEEEEGPVFDFIDDLVNNVLSICEPQPSTLDDYEFVANEDMEIIEQRSEKSSMKKEYIESSSSSGCGSSSNTEFESLKSNSSESKANEIEQEDNYLPAESFLNETDTNEEDAKDFILNEINLIINTITPTDNETQESIHKGANAFSATHDDIEVDQSKDDFKIIDGNSFKNANDSENVDKTNVENGLDNKDREDSDQDLNVTNQESTEVEQIPDDVTSTNVDVVESVVDIKSGITVDDNISNVAHEEQELNISNQDSTEVEQIREDVAIIDVHAVESATDIQNGINVDNNINNEAHEEQDLNVTNKEIGEVDQVRDDINVVENKNGINVENEVHEDLEPDNGSNVSFVFPFIEDQTDEKQKKVTFSNLNIDTVKENVKSSKQSSSKNAIYDISNDNEQTQKCFSKILIIGPANENLLSNADEIWPRDHFFPSVTEGVSLSITSLGKILENEISENGSNDTVSKILSNSDESKSHDSHNEKESIPEEVMNNMKLVDPKIKHSESKLEFETRSIILRPKEEYPQLRVDHDSKEESLALKSEQIDKSKQQALPRDKELTIRKDKNLCTADFETKVAPETLHYVLPEIKLNYKVDFNTAPSWVLLGYGELREESMDNHTCKNKRAQNINKDVIQKWCNVLEYVVSNLDLWQSWIEHNCNIIIENPKRKEVNEWIELKKNVDRNITSWTKFYTCMQKKQSSYKRNYINVSEAASSTECCMECCCEKLFQRNSKIS